MDIYIPDSPGFAALNPKNRIGKKAADDMNAYINKVKTENKQKDPLDMRNTKSNGYFGIF